MSEGPLYKSIVTGKRDNALTILVRKRLRRALSSRGVSSTAGAGQRCALWSRVKVASSAPQPQVQTAPTPLHAQSIRVGRLHQLRRQFSLVLVFPAPLVLETVPEFEGCFVSSVPEFEFESALHCYLSEQRFHVCFETFHSRLLSRWAALFRVRVRGCRADETPLELETPAPTREVFPATLVRKRQLCSPSGVSSTSAHHNTHPSR